MLCANLSTSNSRLVLTFWMRLDVAAVREGWKSAVKDWRVSRAAICVGSERRVGSMVEEAAGVGESGGMEGDLSGGGRRRDSHVWRSDCRLMNRTLVGHFRVKSELLERTE